MYLLNFNVGLALEKKMGSIFPLSLKWFIQLFITFFI